MTKGKRTIGLAVATAALAMVSTTLAPAANAMLWNDGGSGGGGSCLGCSGGFKKR